MQTKQSIEYAYENKILWCSKCQRDLTPDTVWLPDDTHDARVFCFDCASDDAIRAKDTI